MTMSPLSIGRSSSCNITIADPTVSRHHAELTALDGDEFMIVDRGSTSGSYRLDGDKWVKFTRACLRSSDRLRFGHFETSVDDLFRRARRSDEPRPTVVERDPSTGKIVVRSR
jgi:pSer/pThr/pTyr-binding forkhead associated (FHA) protein